MNSACDWLFAALFLGTALHSIIIYRRYREQKLALQRCLSMAERLHTLGEMAACVTHEIRNPLTTVHGYLQMFSHKKEFDTYHGQLQLLLEELDRTNLLIKEYLALSREDAADLKPTQLNTIITSLYPLIQAQANSCGKEVQVELGILPEINLDEKEMRQLILNLSRNGLEAMEKGKILSIRTWQDPSSDEVKLSIRDEGSGIPKHILDNIGKPFQTTKENGTGLGLAVCHRIVKRHKAKMEIQTGNNGTEICVGFGVSK